MKFNRISPIADFYSKFQSQLDILVANQLYSTHQLDKILKIMNQESVDRHIQSQVDDFYKTEPDKSTGRDEEIETV